MRITVGKTLLGTSPEQTGALPVSGLSGSAATEVREARGSCEGARRLALNGNNLATFSVPITRQFDTVAEAEKYLFDTALAGAVEGALTVEFRDGTSTSSTWAIATPANLQHHGVMVSVTWNLRIGAKM